MYRAKPLLAHGGFSPELQSFCDGFRIQELALAGGVCIVPEILASWRQRDDGYAAVGRADPEAQIAILNAVEAKLSLSQSIFPKNYADRLRQRLRFAAAMAAVKKQPVDEAALRIALATQIKIVPSVFAALARTLGRAAAITIFALYFRPYDIPRHLMRRLSRIQ